MRADKQTDKQTLITIIRNHLSAKEKTAEKTKHCMTCAKGVVTSLTHCGE